MSKKYRLKWVLLVLSVIRDLSFVKSDSWFAICDSLFVIVICDSWFVTCDSWFVIRDLWFVIRDLWFVICYVGQWEVIYVIREENVVCCKTLSEKKTKKKKVCWPTHYDYREWFILVFSRRLSRIEVLIGGQTSELQRSALQSQTTRNLLSEVFAEVSKIRLDQSKKGEEKRLCSEILSFEIILCD